LPLTIVIHQPYANPLPTGKRLVYGNPIYTHSLSNDGGSLSEAE
jgi:hypothetical protein